MDYTTPEKKQIVSKTIEALKRNGIDAMLVNSAQEAKDKVLVMIPEGSEVMTMSSITLQETGLAEALNSPPYDSVRTKLKQMDRKTQNREMQRLGAAPEWAVGSVQAVTQDGQVLAASNTGSQLPAYVYGADKVVWVVGTHKIVKDEAEGRQRIYDYIVPLESERARQAYNMPEFNTNVSKLVIFNKETKESRITLIFVDEKLGF